MKFCQWQQPWTVRFSTVVPRDWTKLNYITTEKRIFVCVLKLCYLENCHAKVEIRLMSSFLVSFQYNILSTNSRKWLQRALNGADVGALQYPWASQQTSWGPTQVWPTIASSHYVSQQARSMSGHAQYQSSRTSSPNHMMGFMLDILSCQSRKSAGEINDGCFNLGELVQELWYWACPLIDHACWDIS